MLQFCQQCNKGFLNNQGKDCFCNNQCSLYIYSAIIMVVKNQLGSMDETLGDWP